MRERLALWSVGALLFCGLLGSLYFFVAPIVVSGATVLRPRQLSLSEAMSYYTVLSAWVTLWVGVVGVLLGYLYFKSRLKFDSESLSRDRQRAQLSLLLERLDKVDVSMGRVLELGSGEEERRRESERVLRELDQVVSMVEQGDKLMGIDEGDMRAIVRLNSFAEGYARRLLGSSVVTVEREADRRRERGADKERYGELLQEARRRCISRIC